MKETIKTILLYAYVILIILLVVISLLTSLHNMGSNVVEFLRRIF